MPQVCCGGMDNVFTLLSFVEGIVLVLIVFLFFFSYLNVSGM